MENRDFKILTKMFKQDSGNPHVEGWINIPDTNINLPIVKHPYDSSYYINKNYLQEDGKYGVIWIDSNNSIKSKNELSENTIIHGHNWENYANCPNVPAIGDPHHIMFEQFAAYHHLNFAKERPYIFISNENENMVYKIFAVFYTEEEFKYAIPNPTPVEKEVQMNEAVKRSKFVYKFVREGLLTTYDKIITLSTCTRVLERGRSDQKFVVMARLLRDDESVDDVLPDDYILENHKNKKPQLKKLLTKK